MTNVLPIVVIAYAVRGHMRPAVAAYAAARVGEALLGGTLTNLCAGRCWSTVAFLKAGGVVLTWESAAALGLGAAT